MPVKGKPPTVLGSAKFDYTNTQYSFKISVTDTSI